tara:strand:+ start:3009 stop:3428 length:420 start_codon:yes stop_codon:yes gene_type:complete
MAQAQPTYFVDDAAATALGTRVPDASTDTGMNFGASNNPGIGISDQNPELQESLPSWTLLDQFGNARDGQISQVIGGDGITAVSDWPGSGGTEGTAPDATIRYGANPANVNGQPDNDAAITGVANASLTDLATGWEEGA